jgi:hypothetical protein
MPTPATAGRQTDAFSQRTVPGGARKVRIAERLITLTDNPLARPETTTDEPVADETLVEETLVEEVSIEGPTTRICRHLAEPIVDQSLPRPRRS